MNKAEKYDVALVVAGLLVIGHNYREQRTTNEDIDNAIDTALRFVDRCEQRFNTEMNQDASA
jgi:hypothetical protein